jgi:hypothetical protein
MRRATFLSSGRIVALLLMATGSCGIGLAGAAEQIQHLSITQPGGMPGLPVLGGIQPVTNGVSVTWFGPAGYYQLFEKQAVPGSIWQPVGGLRLTNQAILSPSHLGSLFRVSGPGPQYAGAGVCLECHSGTHATVMKTSHAGAFTNRLFVAHGGQTNLSCLSCHTVGFGLPTGFAVTNRNGVLSYATDLAGVQCENCHGPAGRHAANPGDFTVRPRVEIASTACGGCHGAHPVPARVAASHPNYYPDWNTSAHRTVRDELKLSFAETPNSIANCGRCHSGTVRDAFLENAPLPAGHEAGAIGIACATCHDPHSIHVHDNVLNGVRHFTNKLTGYWYVFTNNAVGPRYTNQLREPLASLRDYRAIGTFATNYDAQINVCAQCHNDRGASYLGTKSPPHPSLQYNMLLGTVGETTNELPPKFPAAHSRIETQCVGCHMQTSTQESGHKFAVTSYKSCVSCHGSEANAEGFVVLIQGILASLCQDVKDGLDQWATNKAPAAIRQYGSLAWEYENAGQLSSPEGGGHGPTKDEQKYIPKNIKKARFNLYLVINDRSGGVHNGPYAITLLQAAQNWVETELNH